MGSRAQIAFPISPQYFHREIGRFQIWFWNERGRGGRWSPTLIVGWGRGGHGVRRVELSRAARFVTQRTNY